MTTALWEILVPTVKTMGASYQRDRLAHAATGEEVLPAQQYYSTRYHRVWDAKVRAITGGLTVMQPVNGQWVAEEELFKERMIPVRIVATRDQIEQIIQMTLVYYDQLAVLCYKLSDEVILSYRSNT